MAISYTKFESTDSEEQQLLMLAQQAVSRNLTPYETSQRLKGIDKTSLQKFFLYYTLFKKGNITNENYEQTVGEFKSKFHNEVREKYTCPANTDATELEKAEIYYKI
ncbi:Uncharacterised protein [Legionella beliardensis]|uniref:Uncharacterized protein n=1 Tax=Legionella beliardensis TaxID=91822 RepID=A0A378JPU6_9GAMM|nr:hypothetical protein [Legionella beliardensis]STX55626.1 Uncharacterised protein [Legionella beliardensis]